MQAKNATHNTIEAGKHHVEFKLNIAGTDIPAADIEKLTMEGALFSEYSIGNCNLRQATIKVPGNYTPGDVVRIYARVANSTSAGPWILLNTLIIYSRELIDGTYSSIKAYDALCQAEYVYKREPTWADTTADAVVAGICADLGLTLTTRAQGILPTYDFPDPNSMTARDILCNIAVAAAANWCMTYDGKLDLVPLVVPASYVYDIQGADIALDSYAQKITYSAWVGVELEGQSLVYRSPSGLDADQWDALKETGRIMSARCFFATQEMADDILDTLQSTTVQFSPWQASGNVDICAELGDGVQIQGVQSLLGNYSFDANGGRLYGTIGAHGISNIANLSPYTPKVERQIAAEADYRRAAIQVLDTAITSEVSERVTQYGSLAQDISDSADRLQGEINDANDALDTVTERMSTVEQTAAGITTTLSQSITELKDYADTAAAGAADNLASTLETYMRYSIQGGAGVLELGDNTSGYVVKLSNQELGFYDSNGSKVAYISNNKLFITNTEVTDTMQLGKYQWIIDNDQSSPTFGRMSLKWVD